MKLEIFATSFHSILLDVPHVHDEDNKVEIYIYIYIYINISEKDYQIKSKNIFSTFRGTAPYMFIFKAKESSHQNPCKG